MISIKPLNNTYRNGYYLCENGQIFDSVDNKYIKPDIQHCYTLIMANKQSRRVTAKALYRELYDKEYCIDNTKNLENEQWKEVLDSHGKYLVSNKGRVKSYQHYKAMILKPYSNKEGYLRVDISVYGNRKSMIVHRLVASAFLPMPERIDMEIHHKDFNNQNNDADNLIWLTPKDHHKIHSERKKTDVSTKSEKDIH